MYKRQFQSGDKQAFSEAAWAAQEIIASGFHQLINQCCFINIEIAIQAETFKILYTDRINLIAHTFLFLNDNIQSY